MPDIAVGKGLHADASAIIGYRSSRAGPAGLVLGADAVIRSGTVIDLGSRIGARFNCYLAQFSEIADDAFLAPGVTIANDLYPGQASSAAVMSGPLIGAGAQIGVNVTILPFVRIGAGCLIGAGAVVVRDVPDGTVAYGNPATVRGEVRGLRAIEDRVDAVAMSVSRYRLAAGVPRGSAAGMGQR